MDYKKLNEKMSEFFDNVTGEELVAQLEELGYKLIEKEQKVKSVDLADVVNCSSCKYQMNGTTEPCRSCILFSNHTPK